MMILERVWLTLETFCVYYAMEMKIVLIFYAAHCSIVWCQHIFLVERKI